MTHTIFIKMLTALAILCAAAVQAERAEITLSAPLDADLDAYCLDIRGSKQNADVSSGLQTHTCYAYQGQMGIDQMFDTARLNDKTLYMPEFDVCATLASFDAGSAVSLTTCNASEAQSIALTDQGHLSPTAAPAMCLTAGHETRLGRGGTSKHQIKSLTLEACSDDLAPYQQWAPRFAPGK